MNEPDSMIGLLVRKLSTLTFARWTGSSEPFGIDKAMNLLWEFEQSYPVARLTLLKVPCWHILRYGIWMKLWKQTNNSRKAMVFNTYKLGIDAPQRESYKTELGATAPDDVARADYLVFTNLNSSDRTLMEGGAYQRIVDPVVEALSTLGTVRKVIPLKTPSNLAGEPYVIEPDYVVPDPAITIGEIPPVRSVGWNFLQEVTRHFRIVKLNEQRLSELIVAYKVLEEYYARILRAAQPKVVFFMNLGIHMPLCEAAKKLGIRSVELQHGAQKENTPIYTWRQVPAAGYPGLPDYFGVWGEADARHIRDVFNGTVKPVVTGYEWLNSPLNREMTDDCAKAIRRIRENYNTIALYTLQNQKELPKDILDLANRTPNTCFVIRKHPKWSNGFPDSANIAENVILDPALQGGAIISLLELVDVHITRDSTSAYEANYLGIPTFVHSLEGHRMYDEEIQNGTVFDLNVLEKLLSSKEGLAEFLEDYKSSQTGVMVSKVSLTEVLAAIC